VARQTRSQRRARREAREASAAAASAPPRRRVSQSVSTAGDGGTSVEVAPKKEHEGNRLFRFIGESYGELKKVDWPNQTQVITGTTVVLIACLIVGFYLYVNDEVWKRVVEHIFLR
jgi:preprotein translocase subunit SecE